MKIKVRIAEKEKILLPIVTDFIRLDSALKLANAVSSGGEAKTVVLDGKVKVGGEVCLQRGKKLREGDEFEFGNVIYEVTK
ncbi:MAG: RNA-binding S4 domain-containing protein [Clostridia bacterium]|nr:RNA-binding S4 domain-containing protein [Clostridia bacterium]